MIALECLLHQSPRTRPGRSDKVNWVRGTDPGLAPVIYLVNEPALEQFWSALTMSMEVEGDARVTAHSEVVVHGENLRPTVQPQVPLVLDPYLPPAGR